MPNFPTYLSKDITKIDNAVAIVEILVQEQLNHMKYYWECNTFHVAVIKTYTEIKMCDLEPFFPKSSHICVNIIE